MHERCNDLRGNKALRMRLDGWKAIYYLSPMNAGSSIDTTEQSKFKGGSYSSKTYK